MNATGLSKPSNHKGGVSPPHNQNKIGDNQMNIITRIADKIHDMKPSTKALRKELDYLGTESRRLAFRIRTVQNAEKIQNLSNGYLKAYIKNDDVQDLRRHLVCKTAVETAKELYLR